MRDYKYTLDRPHVSGWTDQRHVDAVQGALWRERSDELAFGTHIGDEKKIWLTLSLSGMLIAAEYSWDG